MQRLSITRKILISYVLLVVIVAAFSVLMVLPGQIQEMNTHLETTLSRIAYILAHDVEIKSALEDGKCSTHLLHRIDGISEITKSNVDYIVIANTDSVRLYHPDKNLIGKKFTGGDEDDAINGVRSKYITIHKGLPDFQMRAFHAVTNDYNEIIGFVMASTSTDSIENRKREIVASAFGFLAISLVTGLFLAYAISTSIRRILLGYDPTTFAKMYLQREEILDKLNEGIFVVNENFKIIYKNMSAKIYIIEDTLDKESPIYAGVAESLHSNLITSWSMVEIDEKPFLVSLVPLRPLENLDAVMVILRNRTEFVNLTEQLTGLNHIIDALRANTHEFRNKLHIISGLLQLGENSQAMEFINEEAMIHGGQNILHLIQDKTIAALLIGKANRAAELDIEFELRSDSDLPEKNSFLSTRELSLIIGNLIENSFEAMTDTTLERQVEVFISANAQGLTLTVDDTGCGMTAEQIKKIGVGSYTTKGTGHGYGLKLIREVVERHNGFLQIESEPNIGTSITVNIFQSD